MCFYDFRCSLFFLLSPLFICIWLLFTFLLSYVHFYWSTHKRRVISLNTRQFVWIVECWIAIGYRSQWNICIHFYDPITFIAHNFTMCTLAHKCSGSILQWIKLFGAFLRVFVSGSFAQYKLFVRLFFAWSLLDRYE